MPRLSPDKIAILNRNINRYAPAQIAKFIFEGQVDLADLTALTGEKRDIVEQQVKQQREEEAKKPNAQEQAQWAAISALLPATDDIDAQRTLCAQLQNYISQWSATLPTGNHVAEAQQRLAAAKALIAAATVQEEQADWDACRRATEGLTAAADQPVRLHHVALFISRHPESAHLASLEETAWDCVLRSDDKAYATSFYRQHFPTGRHTADIAKLETEQTDWDAVASSPDILKVRRFIETHPASVYLANARQRYDELREEIFEKLRRQDNTISAAYILQLLDGGVISEAELVQRGLCPVGFTAKLRDHVKMYDGLPDILTEITKCRKECATNKHTDVYFFGIPSTGKSCLLMGFIGAPSVNTDSVRAGGPYAMALQQYLMASSTIGSTPPDFVATLQSTILNDDKRSAHYVNLVEIAGEDFACKIADNPTGDISFADMGKGLPELLANDNPKIFFLVIDPTTECVTINRPEPDHTPDGRPVLDINGQPVLVTRKRNILQSLTLKRMVDLMCQPENDDIMHKVEAIHIIVTKADTLGEGAERDRRAAELIDQLYGKILDPLKVMCKHHAINKSTDNTPVRYTFSLGNFYIGGIYNYNPTDAQKLVGVIKQLTPSYKLSRGFFGNIAEFFNS